ncbi:MAG: hypothetical protein ABJF01_05150 [bacterium]
MSDVNPPAVAGYEFVRRGAIWSEAPAGFGSNFGDTAVLTY